MFNPIRRSRKIGKTQGGRVIDGRTEEKWSRFFGHNIWNQLSEIPLREGECRVFRENPSKDFYHPCSPEEYLGLLNRLPKELSYHLKAIILRRTPKNDQRSGVEARRRFSCVIVNSFPRNNRMTWATPPTETAISHYDPWCKNWVTEPGVWALEWSTDEIRRYYLYHLFLHELGHINQPAYHALKRREDFAENFALNWAQQLGVLP